MKRRVLELPRWPTGAEVAVSLTFDVDAEAGWLGQDSSYQRRLTTLSAARYGVQRGLPRILELLASHHIQATFYVPGATAERHSDALRAIVDAGHEVGHHGHAHLRSDTIDVHRQRTELEDGLTALASYLDTIPTGYRSPSWEITPETFALLAKYGFTYDSSCMGDDRPYFEEHNGTSIIELPVHWSLDDWPYYGWTSEAGGQLSTPGHWLEVWLGEFENALRDRGHVTYTMHPEVIGRGYRLPALQELITQMRARAHVWFATHHQVVAAVCDPSAGA